ncbi:protein of unknown function [Pseudogulbenkiania sp. NH8B]|uniref:DUF3631 domain-containing protein n=1 Tax=Pseudogulbenkiania sp. (strain NH8B) TaxID=748280 RepID=UPI000227946C|nr:DUF3631 domain-containing protein [Pseudogulbenkiania sp. NH8B]BAK75340.1 protein of unknown function [Pseudogulbenkiania sp. NH8B]
MSAAHDFDRLSQAGDAAPVDPLQLETEDELIERLAGLSVLAYERTKKAAAERLGLDLSGLKRVVDEQRKRSQAANDEDAAGRGMLFEDIEPWPETLDGSMLLDDLTAAVRCYVICQPETAQAAALWACMTWLIDVVNVAPIANITAPERNCGKSVMLSTLAKLAKRPLMASNITPAALFRAVEQWQPTLFIDEADAFADDNEELRGLINSGHTRETAFVVRVVGDDHEPRMFTTWSAKAMAGIGKRAGTIESRAIPLRLRRKLPHESTARLRSADADELFATLRRQVMRWASDNASRMARHIPAMPEALQNRNADNWEPLLSIADLAGGHWPATARHAALTLSGVEEAPSVDQELLGDIKEVFEVRGVARLFSADLLNALIGDEEKSWATYNRGRPMTLKQLANRLKGYGIKARQIKVHLENRNGYRLEDFADAFARYLAETATPSSTTLPANNGGTFRVEGAVEGRAYGTRHSTLEPLPDKENRVVEDRNPTSAQSDDEWLSDYAAAESPEELF